MRTTLIAMVVVAVSAMGGCRSRPIQQEIAGLESVGSEPLGVQVENWHGTVLVRVDDRLSEPRVSVRPRRVDRPLRQRASSSMRKAMEVDARVERRGDRSWLVVRARTAWDDPDDVASNVVVTVPLSRDVVVRNAGGFVELIGVGGTISVENGANGGAGGLVIVRTDRPMTEAVTITTVDGDVWYQVGPESTGLFVLESPDGTAEMHATVGTVQSEPIVTPHRWTGTLNGGTNLVSLRSGSGRVRAVVSTSAQADAPSHWDPEWPWWLPSDD